MGKTAAQLTPREIRRYRDLARGRDESETRSMLERRERALQVARTAARILKEDFAAGRVLLFGSLATQTWFHIRSDVDVAVDGLKREDYWRADCRLEEIAQGFEIDLVDLPTAPQELRQRILEDGIERVFELNAADLDGAAPGAETWHAELLRQIATDVPSHRPAVISGPTRRHLDEYRRFRHRVRNIYAASLNASQLQSLVSDLPGTSGALKAELAAFAVFLDSLSR